MSDWVGYGVSVNCGETLGCYQGTILEADAVTITLTKAFRNGFQYPKSQVTLNAADIRDLRIISPRVEGSGGRRARATVCETLQANHTTANGNGSLLSNLNTNNGKTVLDLASRAAEFLPTRLRHSITNNQHGGHGASGSSGKSRGHGGAAPGMPGAACPGDKARRRNEACFGEAAEPALLDDFDFEGNLALFDKRAVWASMRHAKPDLVRAADESKYRHDENVLGGGGATACTRVPGALRGPRDYVTDSGARVQSVSDALRRRLWACAARLGLAESALTLVARAACDAALRLVGGSRRLEARNAHQAPCVVCVAGRHAGGAAGLQAARLLASRGARVHALLAGAGDGDCAALERELAALALDGVGVATESSADALPAAPDLVLVALYDPMAVRETCMEQYGVACAWTAGTRAAAVCVEPAGGGWADVQVRACVLGLAAPVLTAAMGKVLLADVGAPRRLYADLGVEYRPPFGAAPLLALHPATDDD